MKTTNLLLIFAFLLFFSCKEETQIAEQELSTPKRTIEKTSEEVISGTDTLVLYELDCKWVRERCKRTTIKTYALTLASHSKGTVSGSLSLKNDITVKGTNYKATLTVTNNAGTVVFTKSIDEDNYQESYLLDLFLTDASHYYTITIISSYEGCTPGLVDQKTYVSRIAVDQYSNNQVYQSPDTVYTNSRACK